MSFSDGAFGGPLALVVDDDVEQAQVLSFLLSRLGFQVAIAHDGMSATMQAAKINPSVVLLDFEMPAGDGAAVYKRLRGLAQTQRTPVVFVSARKIADVSKGIPPGPTVRFLTKPARLEDISKALSEIMPPDVWSAPPEQVPPP